MVFFVCNHCGESMKKQVVATHAFRCRRAISVSCMDCLKDFLGKAYEAHTVCISEEEKYAAKGFVAKEKKNVKKQEGWISLIRSITQRHQNLSPGVMAVFELINRNENVPRKFKPFVNFIRNSSRSLSRNDVEDAWGIIEQEVKRELQTNAPQQNGANKEPSVPTKTTDSTADPGESNEAQKTSVAEEEEEPTKQKKRKTENTSENGQELVEESQPTKQKKRKTKNGHEETPGTVANGTNGTEQVQHDGEQGKFHWSDVIRELLLAKNNEMKLAKLKKKVMKRYQQTTGSMEADGKFDRKFQKKIAKNGFVVVENDTVRLVEA
ncbi:cell growth-regulating nucleolar protein [Anopheles stephensi]|uniref:cell growth-regulating nucleolar protein n=1 Tax=Anopheles stephensi TaxID=30069 RepID=UPI0016589069|nr:cell growth-regulating nucleolar protein [Anopheles stephensi]